MQNAIPAQILNDVYKCIATRHEVDLAKLDRNKIPDDEFMAALAYHQGAPLIEAADIDDDLLASCRNLARELEVGALEDYKFVPLAMRGQVLIVISVCPWDPITPEIIGSYFQQCPWVRFALISQTNFDQLIAKMKATGAQPTTVAGYASKPAAKPPVQPPPVPIPPPARPAASGPQPTAGRTAAPAPAVAAPTMQGDVHARLTEVIGTLSQEEVTYLVNLVVTEGQKIIQRKQRRNV